MTFVMSYHFGVLAFKQLPVDLSAGSKVCLDVQDLHWFNRFADVLGRSLQ